MTDRYSAFLVVLEQGIRDDDAEHLIAAIKQLRGVADVHPRDVDVVEVMIAKAQLKVELFNGLVSKLRDILE